MDIDEARQFVAEHHRGILATLRRDGRPQLSPVTAVVDDAGRLLVSSRETAYKVKNLLANPWASYCGITEGFFGLWVQVEGTVEVVHLPEAMELLVDYYRRAAGEHPDWDDYRAAMERDRRVVIRLTIDRAGPNVSG
jgi:PPOX class probable F420-dependent enzyme